MSPKKAYLIAYNVAMCAGWSMILVKIILNFVNGGSVADVYAQIIPLLVVFQTGAIAEIVHAAAGLVRSPVVTTTLQVFSRLLVLYGAIEIGDTESRRSFSFVQMVIAWSLSEIIRYTFYALNLVEVKLAPITWLRYSAFMVLYPIGITGEIGCLYQALPYIKEHKPWTWELPNTMNITYSWYNSVWFTLIAIYPYGSYVMYSYMLSQRRKVLSRPSEPAKRD